MYPAELMSGQGRYLQAGVVQMSLANLVIIVVMVVMFVLALVLPFPAPGDGSSETQDVRR